MNHVVENHYLQNTNIHYVDQVLKYQVKRQKHIIIFQKK